MDSLIDRARRGEATAAELAELAAWRAADEANERHYREVMQILDAAASLRADLAAPPPPHIAARITRDAGSRRDAGRPAAARARGARWRRHLPWSVAAAAVALLVVNVVAPLGDRQPAAVQHAEIVTGVGEIATVHLGDGSVVRLAGESRLRVGDGGDARTVTLDGRAFFSVAHSPSQPFRVQTSAGTATVLGTRFELRTDEAGLRLAVVEGRVALDAPENRVIVSAGEASAVSNRVASSPSPIADTDRALLWTGRFLAFQNTPLRTAAREIEAHYDVRITIADSTLGEQTVTAVFTGQDLEAVLPVICEIVSARCVAHDGGITVSPR